MRPLIIRESNQGFEDIIYGAPSRALSSYMAEKLSHISGFLNEKTKNFISRSTELYNQFSSDSARRRISDKILNNNISLSRDSITSLTESNYRNINNINRRYLMVNPEIYTNYKKGRVSGYSGAYEDRDRYEEDVYWKRDYLRVMSGVVTSNENEERTKYITICGEEEPLVFSEQLVIMKNWKFASRMLAEDIDITEDGIEA